jgi:hypothetical protein
MQAVDTHGSSQPRTSSPSIAPRRPSFLPTQTVIDTFPPHGESSQPDFSLSVESSSSQRTSSSTIESSRRASSPSVQHARSSSPSIPPPVPQRASEPSMQPRASSPVLPPSVVQIRPSAMPLRSPDVSLPGLPPQRAPSPTGFEPTGFERTQQMDTPPDVLALVAAGSSTGIVPSGPQTDPVIKLLYPHGKRQIPLDLDNTPDRKQGMSFGSKIALWTAALAVGGAAVGALIANLLA